MRTTIHIEDDVLEQARAAAERAKTSIRKIVNEALRAGLNAMQASDGNKPYRTEPHAMGLKEGHNLDNMQELLAQIEGEDAR
jgi:hypothetical protein